MESSKTQRLPDPPTSHSTLSVQAIPQPLFLLPNQVRLTPLTRQVSYLAAGDLHSSKYSR